MMQEEKSTKWQVRLPLMLAVTLTVGMFIGQQLPRYDRDLYFQMGTPNGASSGTLDEILRYVQSKYVDSVDISDIKTGAIDHLLEQLDPHSVYISPEELQAVEDDMSGEFEGVGIEYVVVDDTMQVVSVFPGGPSEMAGMLSGDKIITIADTTVAGVKVENKKIFKYLRGKKGTQVELGVLRGREKNLREFNITRDIIPVHSVDVAYMLDEHTGYVKINRFSATTYREFMEVLQPMVENKSMQNLVLDLRGNPGGYLNEATDLLSQFFSDGKLLVYTKGRTEARRDYKSNGRARFNLQSIAVLIDEGSASASEIVAGAIQDWDRGWVVGRRSFGKGLVQEQYPLGDGGALRLTVARYYTPSGRSIQRAYKHNEEYGHEAERRLKSGELADATKIKIADSTQYYTGMGRIVYGGGGVYPDVFIPIDTSFSSDYFFEMRQLIPQYAARWLEQNDRNILPPNLDGFVSNFQVNDAMLDALVAYAEKQGTKPHPAELAKCRTELKHQLKARIAKALYREEGLYRVLNDDDPAVEKALQLLRSGQPIVKK
ncbi:MAG TPA: S41 family peptidase [Saprospiraceae bacterium]|nr:S41 family peptidase [Saprospiraceae bacterium]HPI07663.1 S41 family peptidase [Saprospiraceae bacterium]